MNDARCEFCKAHVGWPGRPTQRPACRKCGKPPSAKTLEHMANDEKHIDEFRALLAKRAAESNPSELIKKRVQAGFTFYQAAKLAGVDPLALGEIERGIRPASAAEGEKLDALYRGDH